MPIQTPELSPDELSELLSGLMPEIPDCRVMRLIGRGGMSYVYLGVQESLDRQVAIKVIAPHALKDEVSKARFEKEARTIAKLQHPCIVSIHAVGRSEQGLLFYVLPYLSKGHVGQRDLTRDDARVIEVVRALLWALDYAHAHGVVHRDVKAENVLFDNADRPLLTDFGIAISQRDRSRMTGDGFAVGSGAHMAPEQARGEKVDGRADLYSLGVLTFEMVCGHLPFQNPDALGLALMHAVDPVPRLPAEKRHWQEFIDKAMAKAPDNRFADAREMMAALERIVVELEHGPVRRLPSGAQLVAPLKRWIGANTRAAVAAVAAAGGIALLAAAIAFWPAATPPAESTAVITPAPEISREAPPLALVAQTAGAIAGNASDADADVTVPEPEPAAPGELELQAAREQIARRSLTLPPGNNAFDSLLAAHAVVPSSSSLRVAGQRWLAAVTPYLSAALDERNGEVAKTLFDKAGSLATTLQLHDTEAWGELEQAVLAPFKARLQAGVAGNDLAALRATRADALALGIAPARLEPLWSQPVITAVAGDAVRSGGTTLRLVQLPGKGRPGLAAMPDAVTRADYSAFVAATGHASAGCRIRTAMMTLKKRSWDRPGFAQQGNHPVVCVSAVDASAYAAWLGRRDGQRYRLPAAAELERLGLAATGTPACSAGRAGCEGTAATGAGAVASFGLRTLAGNAREWSSDCRDDCRTRLSVGRSWRDALGKSGSRQVDAIEHDSGYDDVGFRLLREVAATELEQR